MVNAPKKGWYLIYSDGRLIDNPKDWIIVPDKAMPAIKKIIEWVNEDCEFNEE